MISRFVLNRRSLESFPSDLLDGSIETLRAAERIVRQLGFSDFDHLPPVPLSERLSWAIVAMEDGEGSDRDGSGPAV